MKTKLASALGVMVAMAGCGGGPSGSQDATPPTKLLGQVQADGSASTSLQYFRDRYAIVRNADGTTTLTGLSDRMTRTYPAAMRTIKFVDQFVSFDAAGIPGQAYRLYQAAFNRQPDLGGLGFWIHILQGGTSLETVAGYFNSSPEFEALYGAVSDDQFVRLLYSNVLHRVPDPGGQAFWSTQMKNGLSRERVLVYFSESPENVDKVGAAIQNGIAYTPDPAELGVASVSIAEYATQGVTLSLSMAGIWDPVGVPGASLIDFWNIVKLGPEQKQGIVLAGWAYSGFSNTATDVTPTRAAVLAQQDDGTLKLATEQFVPSAVTNGAGSVIVADFNADGKDDIFLPAHNESPFVPKASTAYLSRPDGTFAKAVLPDSVMNHHASLAYLDGKPTVLGASFNHDMANPIYTYDGNGNFNVNNSSGFVGAMSVAAADFAGDGKPSIVYGDALWGFNLDYSDTRPMQQYLYSYIDGKIVGKPTSLPAPYFNDKPGYSQFVSQYGVSKTHNARLWTDDLNQDGRPDIVVGGEIWSGSAGLQKTVLQMLINGGNLKFSDQTDILNPQYNQNAYYDYSLRMADVDQSGINTYFGAQQSLSVLVGSAYVPQKLRQGNYILVNDGTGRLHVAMHDEFIKMGDAVNQYVATQLRGGQYFANTEADTPRFIAYQTPKGLINFLASVAVSANVNGNWVSKFALVNVPAGISLTTQYKENITISERNGSHNIRTFAGDDIIHAAKDSGYCSIDGGAGNNMLVYPGKRSNYTVTRTPGGYTVIDSVGPGGKDTLKRIQILQFADTSLTLN